MRIIFSNFNDIKLFLYLCRHVKFFFFYVKSFFWIPIKTFLIKVLPGKKFCLKALLQEAVLNWP